MLWFTCLRKHCVMLKLLFHVVGSHSRLVRILSISFYNKKTLTLGATTNGAGTRCGYSPPGQCDNRVTVAILVTSKPTVDHYTPLSARISVYH